MKLIALIRRLLAGPGQVAPTLLGACDEAALRTGLALRQARAGLAAIACGPEEREDEVLRHALDQGADRAIRIGDPSLDGVDYHGVARVLAAATRSVGFDLVLCGDHSDDEGHGAIGPAVAEALGVPHVTAAVDVRLDEGAAIVARRDGASVRTLRLKLPLVVAVARSTAKRPGVTLRDGSVIETLTLDELGILTPELRHRLRSAGHATPARKGVGATMLARPDDLIARLRADRLLP